MEDPRPTPTTRQWSTDSSSGFSTSTASTSGPLTPTPPAALTLPEPYIQQSPENSAGLPVAEPLSFDSDSGGLPGRSKSRGNDARITDYFPKKAREMPVSILRTAESPSKTIRRSASPGVRFQTLPPPPLTPTRPPGRARLGVPINPDLDMDDPRNLEIDDSEASDNSGSDQESDSAPLLPDSTGPRKTSPASAVEEQTEVPAPFALKVHDFALPLPQRRPTDDQPPVPSRPSLDQLRKDGLLPAQSAPTVPQAPAPIIAEAPERPTVGQLKKDGQIAHQSSPARLPTPENARSAEEKLEKVLQELAVPIVVARKKDESPVNGGAFADVWRGIMEPDDKPVALKVLRLHLRGTDTQRLHRAIAREVSVWARANNKNVLPFLGVRPQDDGNGLWLVSPWMEKGDIKTYLGNNPTADRLSLAAGVTSGVAYLHRNKIVHGDLKANNILVDAEGNPRIADFGLSVVLDDVLPEQTTSTMFAGSVRWMSPERIQPARFNLTPTTSRTLAGDVHSLAMTLYEIFTLKLPFHELTQMDVPRAITNGDRPPHPGEEAEKVGLSDDLWSFMQQCWAEDPKARPDLAEQSDDEDERGSDTDDERDQPPEYLVDSRTTSTRVTDSSFQSLPSVPSTPLKPLQTDAYFSADGPEIRDQLNPTAVPRIVMQERSAGSRQQSAPLASETIEGATPTNPKLSIPDRATPPVVPTFETQTTISDRVSTTVPLPEAVVPASLNPPPDVIKAEEAVLTPMITTMPNQEPRNGHAPPSAPKRTPSPEDRRSSAASPPMKNESPRQGMGGMEQPLPSQPDEHALVETPSQQEIAPLQPQEALPRRPESQNSGTSERDTPAALPKAGTAESRGPDRNPFRNRVMSQPVATHLEIHPNQAREVSSDGAQFLHPRPSAAMPSLDSIWEVLRNEIVEHKVPIPSLPAASGEHARVSPAASSIRTNSFEEIVMEQAAVAGVQMPRLIVKSHESRHSDRDSPTPSGHGVDWHDLMTDAERTPTSRRPTVARRDSARRAGYVRPPEELMTDVESTTRTRKSTPPVTKPVLPVAAPLPLASEPVLNIEQATADLLDLSDPSSENTVALAASQQRTSDNPQPVLVASRFSPEAPPIKGEETRGFREESLMVMGSSSAGATHHVVERDTEVAITAVNPYHGTNLIDLDEPAPLEHGGDLVPVTSHHTGEVSEVIIRNLDKNIREGFLRTLFEQYGTVLDARITMDRYGRSTGNASVSFVNHAEAVRAATEMDNEMIGIQQIQAVAHQPAFSI